MGVILFCFFVEGVPVLVLAPTLSRNGPPPLARTLTFLLPIPIARRIEARREAPPLSLTPYDGSGRTSCDEEANKEVFAIVPDPYPYLDGTVQVLRLAILTGKQDERRPREWGRVGEGEGKGRKRFPDCFPTVTRGCLHHPMRWCSVTMGGTMTRPAPLGKEWCTSMGLVVCIPKTLGVAGPGRMGLGILQL